MMDLISKNNYFRKKAPSYASGIVRLNIFFIYTHFIFIDTKLKTYILKPISRKQWSQ